MDILSNGHKEGIIEEVTNIVDEYMTGKYNRGYWMLEGMSHSMDDRCVLSIPRYSGDHWNQESELKCKELLQIQSQLQKQPEEVDSDVTPMKRL